MLGVRYHSNYEDNIRGVYLLKYCFFFISKHPTETRGRRTQKRGAQKSKSGFRRPSAKPSLSKAGTVARLIDFKAP